MIIRKLEVFVWVMPNRTTWAVAEKSLCYSLTEGRLALREKQRRNVEREKERDT